MAGAVGLAAYSARMEFLHSCTNIVLVGIPDHVFAWPDGSMTLTDDGYTQPWQVHVALIDVSGEGTVELLEEAREIYEQQIAPDGRAECLDCELLENVVSISRRHNLKKADSLRYLTRSEQAQYIAKANYDRLMSSHGDRRSTVTDAPSDGSSLLLAWD
jgi:hypothetical protein